MANDDNNKRQRAVQYPPGLIDPTVRYFAWLNGQSPSTGSGGGSQAQFGLPQSGPAYGLPRAVVSGQAGSILPGTAISQSVLNQKPVTLSPIPPSQSRSVSGPRQTPDSIQLPEVYETGPKCDDAYHGETVSQTNVDSDGNMRTQYCAPYYRYGPVVQHSFQTHEKYHQDDIAKRFPDAATRADQLDSFTKKNPGVLEVPAYRKQIDELDDFLANNGPDTPGWRSALDARIALLKRLEYFQSLAPSKASS